MLRPLVGLGLFSLVLASACGSGTDLGAGTPSTTTTGGTAGSGGAGTTTGGTGGDGIGGGLINTGSGGSSSGTGCEKVDFLFVIDNSVSMGDQQKALIASFPSFMATIQTTLSATDYHIMVADTDDATRCTKDNCTTGAMAAQKLCIDAANGYACKTKFEKCDTIIGAGVLHPAGEGASNKKCEVFGGNRYIVDGEPDLTGTFGCVAQVGLAGHPSERPMDSLVAAMSDQLNGPGGCNDGFLRDDAILVVTFISDDPNYEDAGKPPDWYDAVVKAKGGNAGAVVVLGLTPFEGCAKPGKGAHWHEFIGLWGKRGLEASVCSPDYAPFFQQAVDIIDETCDEFVPPS